MSKADKARRRARARQNKAQWEGAVALAPVEPRQARTASGRFANRDDPPKAALAKRCELAGLQNNRETRKEVSAPMHSSDIGRCINYSHKPDKAKALWSVWQAWCMVETSYRNHFLGRSESAKGASMEMVREPVEADKGHSIDTRTAEEKARDAVSTWMRWQGFLGHLHAAESTLLHQVRRDESGVLWADKAPTRLGQQAVACLGRLAVVAEGKSSAGKPS